MIQIEEYCCNNSNEASARERYWYETLNANMNTCIPNRSKNEYEQEYYIEKKEHIQQYYEINKENIQKYKKQYYKDNKDKINQQYNCECGGKYVYNNKSRHFKSQKHQIYINSLVNEDNII